MSDRRIINDYELEDHAKKVKQVKKSQKTLFPDQEPQDPFVIPDRCPLPNATEVEEVELS